VKSDAELATAIWRNFLGARGAEGFDGRGQAINPTVSPAAADMPRDPLADDKSGIRDFEGTERDHYLEYPTLLWNFCSYIRIEAERLANVSDESILSGNPGSFGSLLKIKEQRSS
jgi:cytochrome b pre-mRNA-processing protein 3